MIIGPKLDRVNRPLAEAILTSVFFWPLFIIESVARVSQHVLSRTTCSLNRYNVKGELDCFNYKTGVFVRLFTSMFTRESNYNPCFCEKKSTRLWGIFNNYKENISVLRVHTAAMITIMHQFS